MSEKTHKEKIQEISDLLNQIENTQNIWDKADIVNKLPSEIRIGKYIEKYIQFANAMALVRLDNRPDEEWTEEDDAIYEYHCDELDPWWHGLTEQERERLDSMTLFISTIARGEKLFGGKL